MIPTLRPFPSTETKTCLAQNPNTSYQLGIQIHINCYQTALSTGIMAPEIRQAGPQILLDTEEVVDIVTAVNIVRYYVIEIDNILLMDRAIEGVEVTEDAAPLAGILMDTKVDIINDPREVGWISGKRRRYGLFAREWAEPCCLQDNPL